MGVGLGPGETVYLLAESNQSEGPSHARHTANICRIKLESQRQSSINARYRYYCHLQVTSPRKKDSSPRKKDSGTVLWVALASFLLPPGQLWVALTPLGGRSLRDIPELAEAGLPLRKTVTRR